MGVRRNFLSSTQARDQFLDGMLALSRAMTGLMASDVYRFLRNIIPNFRMQGTDQELSDYDLIVVWHAAAMGLSVPKFRRQYPKKTIQKDHRNLRSASADLQ